MQCHNETIFIRGQDIMEFAPFLFVGWVYDFMSSQADRWNHCDGTALRLHFSLRCCEVNFAAP